MKKLVNEVNLKQDERLDDLQVNGYHLIQNTKMFCFGIDTLLLSDVIKAKHKDTVLDLCTGNGILPIFIVAKTNCKNIIGVEIQEKSASLANRNVRLNELTDKITIVRDDIKDYTHTEKVSVVTCNPPYMYNTGLLNEKEALTIARHEILLSLDDIINCAERNLKYGGKFYMVHRAERLVDIMATMRKYKIEPKVVHFIQHDFDSDPNLLIVEGVKGGKCSVKIKRIFIHK